MNTPQPLPNESQEDFTIRAHRELQHAIPDPMARNEAVWNAWETYRGDPERQRAKQFFNSDRFVYRPNVCHWHEHESQVMGPDGQPVPRNNDVNRLKAIVQENNLRIADTDSFSALVDKHTVPSGQRDPLPPKTLGFAGPYRLGMVGRVKPRFAIFGDEHHYREAEQVLRDRPRRSVEVLTLRANGRSYLDPIAAISEAPRLPLPVQYSAQDATAERYQGDPFMPFAPYTRGAAEETVVERYEAEAVPAFPGGGNTYVPGAGGGDNRKRQSTEQFDAPASAGQSDPSTTETTSMPLAQEDLTQIADAIMATPQMQFVTQLMQQQQGDGQNDPNQPPAQPGTPPSGNGAPAPGGAPGQQPPGQQPPAQQPPNGQAPGQQPGQKEPYMNPAAFGGAGGAAGMVANRFSAAADEDEYEIVPDNEQAVTSEQYAALAESQGKLMRQLADVTHRNAQLEARAADADRRERLGALANQHPHFIDLEGEHQRCLYSAGSEMTDDQFESHCEMLEQYASRVPQVTPMVPTGEVPASEQYQARTVQSEQYQARIQDRSVEIYDASVAAGSPKTAEQCWAEAEQEIKGAA